MPFGSDVILVSIFNFKNFPKTVPGVTMRQSAEWQQSKGVSEPLD